MRVGDSMDFVACDSDGNDTHIGQLFVRTTACGKSLGSTFLAREITITCPDCIAEFEYRSAHPEARRIEFGTVTHKRKERK